MKKILGKIPRKISNLLHKNKSLDFGQFILTVSSKDPGGQQYANRDSYEEIESQFYDYLIKEIKPDLVVDVGANYGFTGCIFKSKIQQAKLILIEPSPQLVKYIRINLSRLGIGNYQIIQAICGSSNEVSTSFSINPISSQDNRVYGKKGWKKLQVSSITLTEVLSSEENINSIFIKIDTQGFETQVFKGGENFLTSHDNWFIKTEFAPNWLKSQGNDPKLLLEYLIENFIVVEAPLRTRFARDHLYELFMKPLQSEDIENFVNHVESLNKDRLGWVDLYVAPKSSFDQES